MAPWLIKVLEACASNCLDSEKERELVAERVLDALPTDAILEMVRESIQNVSNRWAKDTGGAAPVDELARNAAQAVLAALETM